MQSIFLITGSKLCIRRNWKNFRRKENSSIPSFFADLNTKLLKLNGKNKGKLIIGQSVEVEFTGVHVKMFSAQVAIKSTQK